MKELLRAVLNRQNRTYVILSAGVSLILTIGAFTAYLSAKSHAPTVVLPGGVTYLGPSTTPKPQESSTYIPVPANATWAIHKCTVYICSFSYPQSLSLGVFPGDQFDGVTIFWKDTNAQQNIFFRVENLNNIPDQQQYISRPKADYAKDWWRQYSWKGVVDVTPFTNESGLKGYRAKYVDDMGKTPYDNIFLEVPGHPELVIWMASRLIEPTVFDKMVDSVSWNPTRAPG